MESTNPSNNIKEDNNLKHMKRQKTILSPIIEKKNDWSLKELCYRFGLPKSIGAFELKDLHFSAYKQLYLFLLTLSCDV